VIRIWRCCQCNIKKDSKGLLYVLIGFAAILFGIAAVLKAIAAVILAVA
jgi:hypothetical protein